MKLSNPGSLILNLLLATEDGLIETAEAVKAGKLLGIGGSSMRVALTRLVASGLLETSARGLYRLSAQGEVLGNAATSWRSAEQRLRPWEGEWIAILTSGLPKAERSAWRNRQRALDLMGLRELEDSLYVRPDNLCGGVDAARLRLATLCQDDGMPVFQVRQLDAARDLRARALWDGTALTAHYRREQHRLEDWMARHTQLPIEQAAREAFQLGDAAMHELVFDPLLPEPLVDVAARQAFTATVLRYDKVGRAIWRRFLQTE